MADQKKWIIVVLIYIDFVIEETFERTVINPVIDKRFLGELDSLCKDILEHDLDKEKCDIYVIFSSVNYTTGIGGQISLKNKTIICNIVKGEQENSIEVLTPIERPQTNGKKLEDVGRYSLQNKEYLTDIFKVIVSRYSDISTHYIKLISWDHGSAFGIFKAEEHPVKVVVEWNDIILSKEYNYLGKFIQAGKTSLKSTMPPLEEFVNTKEHLLIVENRNVYVLDKKQRNDVLFDFLKQNSPVESIKITHHNGRASLGIEGKDKILSSPEFNSFFNDKRSKMENGMNPVFLPESGLEKYGFIDILTNEELADAIAASFKKVDVLIMMNCYMMNLHTIYAFKKVVNFFIAPQGDISNPGYNYAQMLTSIKHGNIDPEQLALTCIESSIDERRKTNKKEIDGWAIFAVKINEKVIDEFVKIINEVANFFSTAIGVDSTIKHYLFYPTKLSFNFSFGLRYYMVDILNWIKLIEIANLNGDGSHIIAGLEAKKFSSGIKALKDLLLSDKFYRIGDRVYLNYEAFKGIISHPPNGLSIYLPAQLDKTEESYKVFLDTKSKDRSSLIEQNPSWLSLLEKFPYNINSE